MILIYTPEITPRIEYTFSFIFECILGLPIQITDSYFLFLNIDTPKFSYSNNTAEIENSIHFKSISLLLEDNIEEQDINTLLTDPFAVCFFLLSRYEEYLNPVTDKHNRFSYQASILKKHIPIQEPYIDRFAYKVFQTLKAKYPELEKRKRLFTFINTLDIDHAWLYKNRGLPKQIKAVTKQVLYRNWNQLSFMYQILAGKKKDPFEIYSFIQNSRTKTLYFISFGREQNKYDTHVSPKNKEYRKLILELEKNPLNTIGLHPSYTSNQNINILKKEKQQLEHLIDRTIEHSRQHYIKLHLPYTYQNLLKTGIVKDYTMGYQDHIGFRAGTCTPFYWFNLSVNTTTALKIFPFCVMDVTLKDYMKLNQEEAKLMLKELVDSVKKVEGTFISIFHNDSLSNYGDWKGWKSIYIDLIDYLKK